METWLYNEIVKLIDGEHMRLHYFRQQEGFEVDFVVSQGEFHILVECKTSLPTAISSMKGITAFLEKFRESPVIIFHGGNLCQQVRPNIYALPFWALCATLS